MAEPSTIQTAAIADTQPLSRLWRRTASHWFVFPFLVAVDLLAVYEAHHFALDLRIGLLPPGQPVPPVAPYERLALTSTLVSWFVLLLLGLYSERTGQSRWRERMQIMLASIAIGMVDLAIIFFDRRLTEAGFTFSRAAWFFVIGFCWLDMAGGRELVRSLQAFLRRRGWGVRRTLIVGSDDLARMVAQRQLAEPSLGYQLIGFAADEGPDPDLPAPWLGLPDQVADIVRGHAIDSVVIAVPDLPRQELLQLITACRQEAGLQVQLVPDILEFLTTKIRVSDLAGLPLVGLQTTPLQRWHNQIIKRLFDIVVASLALLIAGPLLLVIALAVKASSPGPVFYRQERISRGGRRFHILKFRTMRTDAEATTGPVWSPSGDDRRTTLGVWLRRTSLDELPQFFNVLAGDMSVVGPRPERPFFTGQFEQQVTRYVDRHLVKSGITGWAQVHGLRGDVPIADRTAHDLYYIENWSVWLDLQIIMQSFRCVIVDFLSGRAG